MEERPSWLPMGLARGEVRYLPIRSKPIDDSKDSLLELSVICPRRGKTGVEECMECAHGGRLRHHGRRGPMVFECTLERSWRERKA